MHYTPIAPPGAALADLSEFAITCLASRLDPATLDQMAGIFAKAAAELRAAGLHKEAGHA